MSQTGSEVGANTIFQLWLDIRRNYNCDLILIEKKPTEQRATEHQGVVQEPIDLCGSTSVLLPRVDLSVKIKPSSAVALNATC